MAGSGPHTIEQIRGVEGNLWRRLMARWTNQATAAGTKVVVPTHEAAHPGTVKYYQALSAAAGDPLWLPGHGKGRRDRLKTYGDFMACIWKPYLNAIAGNGGSRKFMTPPTPKPLRASKKPPPK